MQLSIVIPVYNSALTIKGLVATIQQELSDIEYEIILVNDGSKDNSEDECEELAILNEKINFISLRNNFEEHNAVMCGLNVATGNYAVIIDDDFQNPPSEIRKLYKEAIKGNFDVVYSRYNVKNHHWLRNLGSKWTNLVASFVLNKPVSLYLSSFKILKKELVEEVIKYKGANLYLDGLLLRITNNIGVYEVEHFARTSGRSNYSFARLFSLFMNMFINHSIRPIRLFMLLGVVITLLASALFFYYLDANIFEQSPHLNWKLFLSGSMFLAGFNAIIMGLIGEYLGKNMINSSPMPQYVIKKKIINNDRTTPRVDEKLLDAKQGRRIR
jgi:polyisoprenyl-phosphate glycosyltransferase